MRRSPGASVEAVQWQAGFVRGSDWRVGSGCAGTLDHRLARLPHECRNFGRQCSRASPPFPLGASARRPTDDTFGSTTSFARSRERTAPFRRRLDGSPTRRAEARCNLGSRARTVRPVIRGGHATCKAARLGTCPRETPRIVNLWISSTRQPSERLRHASEILKGISHTNPLVPRLPRVVGTLLPNGRRRSTHRLVVRLRPNAPHPRTAPSIVTSGAGCARTGERRWPSGA